MDSVLQLSEEGAKPKRPAPTAGSSKSQEPVFVPRTPASRPRAGLGSKKRVGFGAISAGVGIVSKVSSTEGAEAQASSSTKGAGPKAPGKGQDDFRKMLNGA